MTDHETEIRRRICDPGHFIGKRRDDYTESIAFWGSRAVWAYVEPLLQPMDALLVTIVKLRDDAAVLAEEDAVGSNVRTIAKQQWLRYANAATVLTEIIQEQQGVMPDDDDSD